MVTKSSSNSSKGRSNRKTVQTKRGTVTVPKSAKVFPAFLPRRAPVSSGGGGGAPRGLAPVTVAEKQAERRAREAQAAAPAAPTPTPSPQTPSETQRTESLMARPSARDEARPTILFSQKAFARVQEVESDIETIREREVVEERAAAGLAKQKEVTPEELITKVAIERGQIKTLEDVETFTTRPRLVKSSEKIVAAPRELTVSFPTRQAARESVIQPIKEIFEEPGQPIKKTKILLTRPKEFRTAREEIITEADIKGPAAGRRARILSTVSEFSVLNIKPILATAAIVVGAGPIIGGLSRLPSIGPIIGTAAATTGAKVGLGAAFVGGSLIQAERRKQQFPKAFGGKIGKVGLFAVPTLEAATFGALAGFKFKRPNVKSLPSPIPSVKPKSQIITVSPGQAKIIRKAQLFGRIKVERAKDVLSSITKPVRVAAIKTGLKTGLLTLSPTAPIKPKVALTVSGVDDVIIKPFKMKVFRAQDLVSTLTQPARRSLIKIRFKTVKGLNVIDTLVGRVSERTLLTGERLLRRAKGIVPIARIKAFRATDALSTLTRPVKTTAIKLGFKTGFLTFTPSRPAVSALKITGVGDVTRSFGLSGKMKLFRAKDFISTITSPGRKELIKLTFKARKGRITAGKIIGGIGEKTILTGERLLKRTKGIVPIARIKAFRATDALSTLTRPVKTTAIKLGFKTGFLTFTPSRPAVSALKITGVGDVIIKPFKTKVTLGKIRGEVAVESLFFKARRLISPPGLFLRRATSIRTDIGVIGRKDIVTGLKPFAKVGRFDILIKKVARVPPTRPDIFAKTVPQFLKGLSRRFGRTSRLGLVEQLQATRAQQLAASKEFKLDQQLGRQRIKTKFGDILITKKDVKKFKTPFGIVSIEKKPTPLKGFTSPTPEITRKPSVIERPSSTGQVVIQKLRSPKTKVKTKQLFQTVTEVKRPSGKVEGRLKTRQKQVLIPVTERKRGRRGGVRIPIIVTRPAIESTSAQAQAISSALKTPSAIKIVTAQDIGLKTPQDIGLKPVQDALRSTVPRQQLRSLTEPILKTPRVPPPIIKLPPLLKPVRTRTGRKVKRKKPKARFQPSLAAVQDPQMLIRGRRPRILTGIEVRPIPL